MDEPLAGALEWEEREMQKAADRRRIYPDPHDPKYNTGGVFDVAGWEEDMAANIERREARLNARLRFAVLKRDGYRCQLCGRTAQDGVVLHVDHKVARANGGATEEDNLWALCEECNAGKATEDL